MQYSTVAVMALLAVQQAAACDVCEWGEALGLPSCQSSCNQCTQQQQQGLDFSQCPSGASSFGGLDLGGCSIGSWLGLKKRQSFTPRGGKRDLLDVGGALDERNLGDICALGALTGSSGPSFSCSSGTSPFSISNLLVSCDQDTPVQLTYHYDSGAQAGQTCQQTAQLTSGSPNTITNTQCGGASRVECALPPAAPIPSCNLGIHSVGFDCSGCGGGSAATAPAPPPAAATTPPPAPPAPAPPAPAPPAPAPPAPAPPAPAPPAPAPPAPAPPAPAPPAPAPPAPAPPAPPASANASSSPLSMTFPGTPAVPTTTPYTTPSNGTTVIIQSNTPIITTEVVYTTLTSCPVTTTHTQGNYTSVEVIPTLSTLLVTSTQTVCTSCTAPTTTPSAAAVISTTYSVSNTVSSIVVTQSVSASTSVSAVPAPSVLPSCLNTWIKLSGCKDNSDSNCFCNDKDFTKNVQECISAWSNDKDKEQQAFSYLAGICAPHIPNNPGIVTNVPSTITIQPTPAPTGSNSPQSAPAAPGGQTAAAGQPMTTVHISTTVTVACAGATSMLSGSAAASMPSGCSTTSVLDTSVVVPQVAFATPTPGKVGLVAGTPAPAPAVATNANSPAQPAASPAPAAASPNSPVAPASAPPPAAAAPSGVAGSTGAAIQPSSSITPFTGAASSVGSRSVFMSVFLAVAGLAALA